MLQAPLATSIPLLPPSFSQVSFLANGAFGEVYRAKLADGRTAAVKVLSPDRACDPEAVWLFLGEFRRLQGLDHPAYPKTIDEGRTQDGLPYYAMEFVSGRTLAQLVQVTDAELEAHLVQIAAALHYLHGRGLSHGDLKPDNIVIGDDGILHVLDLGQSASLGSPRDQVSGTLEYMAPEVLRRSPVAPAADWYSLGALAHHLATGAPPFSGSPSEIVSAVLSRTAPRIAGRSAALSSLVERLLDKDPSRRPAAPEVIRELTGKRIAPLRRHLAPAALVGREAWLDRYRALLQEAGQRRFDVRGREGMGKTRLLQELRLVAQASGRAVSGARCGRAGSALRSLLRQAFGMAALEPSAMSQAFLQARVPAELNDLEPRARQIALFRAVAADFSRTVMALGGLTILVDDFHEADETDRQFMDFFARNHAEVSVHWLCAERSAEGDLPALDVDETRALVESRLGHAPAPAMLEQLVELTHGVPGRVNDLLELWEELGVLSPEREAWRFDPSLAHADWSMDRERRWRFQAEKLPASARRLLEVTALGGDAGAIPLPLLLSVARLDGVEAHQAIEALATAGFLCESQGRARLAPTGLATWLLEGLTPSSQRTMRSTLIAGITGRAPEDLDAEALTSLPHDMLVQAAALAQGAEPSTAILLGLVAGRRALEQNAPQQAHRLLTAALQAVATDTPPDRVLGLQLALAETERFLNHLDEARKLYEAALPSAGQDRESLLQLRMGLSKVLHMQAQYPSALEQLDAAEPLASSSASLARIALSRARLQLYAGGDTLSSVERAVALARQEGLRLMLAQALNLHAVLLMQESLSHRDRALEMLSEAIELATSLDDRLGLGTAFENLGNTHLSLGEFALAAEAFARYAAINKEMGSETEALAADMNLAIALGNLGRLEEASVLASSVVDRSCAIARKFTWAAGLTVLGQVRWMGGETDLDPLDEALELAVTIKNRYLEEHVRLYRLEALLGLADLVAAKAEYAVTDALNRSLNHAETRARLDLARAEIQLQSGRLSEASELAKSLLDSLNRGVQHGARQILARVALRENHMGIAEANARAAIEIAKAWQSPYHQQRDSALLAASRLASYRQEALALARSSYHDLNGQNPYARAQVIQLILTAGERHEAEALMPSISGAFSTMLASMSSRRQSLFLESYGISGLASFLRNPVAGQDDGALTSLFISAVCQATDEASLASLALGAIMTFFKADRGYLLNYEAGRLKQVVSQGLDYAHELKNQFSQSIVEEVMYTGQLLYLTDAQADEHWREHASIMSLQLHTVVGIPLATAERIVGMIYLDREALEPVLSPADLDMLLSLGTLTAAMMLRERERGTSRRRKEQLEQILDLSSDLLGAVDPEILMRELLRRVRGILHAERGFWVCSDEGGRWMAPLVLDEADQPLVFRPSDVSQGVLDWVSERQEPVCLMDACFAEGWQERVSIMALGLRTIWCFPLKAPLRGLLYFDSTVPGERDAAATLEQIEALISDTSRLSACG